MTDYPGRRRTRRSELERLLDNTVLDPTHPELGSSAGSTAISADPELP
jgi:hypothetical protein